MNKSKIERKTWPKIRRILVKGQQFYQVDARRAGTDGKRETFSVRADAFDRAAALEKQFAESGTEGLSMSRELQVMAANADKLLKPYGKTIMDAASFYKVHLEDLATKSNSKQVGVVVDEWIRAKMKSGLKVLRKASLTDISAAGKTLKTLFADRTILSITSDDIQTYLDGLAVGHRRKYNIRSLFSQFFNWCIKKRHMSSNPAAEIEIQVPASDIAILTFKQAAKACLLVTDKHRDLVLYVAVSLFAGLRPTECEALRWEQVHLEEEQITVLGSTSKTKETRNVPIEENLLVWLQEYKPAEATGLLTSSVNIQKRLKAFRAAMGFRVMGKNPDSPRFTPDIFRHTYASYWLATHKDRPHLAENMGNSLKMIKNHYKSVVASSDAAKFWNLTPSSSQDAVIEKEFMSADTVKAITEMLQSPPLAKK